MTPWPLRNRFAGLRPLRRKKLNGSSSISQALLDAANQRVDSIRNGGVDIVIVAPSGHATEIKANVGETKFEQLGSDGTMLITRATDFIVVTADLPEAITRGHRLQFNSQEYQPNVPGNEPISRDSDRFGLTTRIHTTRSKTSI